MVKYILLPFLIMSFFVEAKIHIEPYVGYSFMWSRPIDLNAIKDTIQDIRNQENQVEQVLSGVGSLQKGLDYIQTTNIYRGYTGGLRFGYSNFGLALGADVSGAFLQQLSKTTLDIRSITSLLPGLFVSYKLPLLFRAYGTIIPNTYGLSFMQIHKNKDNQVVNCVGPGAKVGVSYLSLPFVSINFEYQGMTSTTPSEECRKVYHTLTAFFNIMI